MELTRRNAQVMRLVRMTKITPPKYNIESRNRTVRTRDVFDTARASWTDFVIARKNKMLSKAAMGTQYAQVNLALKAGTQPENDDERARP